MIPNFTGAVDPQEAWVAAVGIEAILFGNVKITAPIRKRVTDMTATIDRMMIAAVNSEPSRVPEIPLDYKAVSKALDDTGNREQIKSFETAFADEDPQLKAHIQEVAGGIIRYLNDHLPRRSRLGIVATPSPPGGVDLARFKRLWQIANNPLTVIESLERGNLSRDLVTVVEDLYPSIYKVMRLAVFKAISRTKARRAGWIPSRQLDLQLRALMQADTITPQLAAEINSVQGAPKGPGAQAQSKSNGDLQTQGQRISQPEKR
jgi:hypothetical protein